MIRSFKGKIRRAKQFNALVHLDEVVLLRFNLGAFFTPSGTSWASIEAPETMGKRKGLVTDRCCQVGKVQIQTS